jgi:hypothetical protein
MAALVALVPFAAVVVDHAEVLTLPTPLATEAIGPSGKLEGREALLLCPISLNYFIEGKPLLVLNLVLGHARVLH